MMDNLVDKKESDSTFWKKRTKSVPGRPILRIEARSISQLIPNSGSFQKFQESVNDAWDIGDDKVCDGGSGNYSRTVQYRTPTTTSTECRSSSELPSGPNVAKSPNTCSMMLHPQVDGNPISQKDKEGVDLPVESKGQMVPSEYSVVDGNVFGEKVPANKLSKFWCLLESRLPVLDDLRCLCWSGIPMEARPTTWRILAGYLPASVERRELVLERKRADYWNLVDQYFHIEEIDNQETFRQIHIDIPRMAPLMAIFLQKTVQEMFERILFLWAIRHPASGYVQGMNDLVTPFFVVFMHEFLPSGDLDEANISAVSKENRDAVEADCFWCLSKFLDVIQDNYIFAQLGVQQKVQQLKELVERIDRNVHDHLQTHGVDYLQFSFRWMNNLLTREIPLRCALRLWDTYLAEADSFASFHPYVCVAFLLRWRRELLAEQDFQGLVIFLQNLPTKNWADSDIDVLLAEAYRLRFSFADSPKHMCTSEKR